MPTCEFQTVAWDADHHPFGVSVPCGQPSTHRLDLVIKGAGAISTEVTSPDDSLGRVFFYCCGHRKDVLAEIDDTAGIRVANDVVLDAAVRTEVAERNGGWQMRLHVKHHGQAVEFPTPWMRLAATSEHGATLEAAARSAAIQTNVNG